MSAHGTVGRYTKENCRCWRCQDAHNRYMFAYRRGVRRLVPADEARSHLAFLKERRIHASDVSRVTGINYETVKYIARGKQKTAHFGTLQKILAVTVKTPGVYEGRGL